MGANNNPAIFKGTRTKLLTQNGIEFKDGQTLTTSTVDPSAVATDALKGSLWVHTDTPDLFIKTDNGISINWNKIPTVVDPTFITKITTPLIRMTPGQTVTPTAGDLAYQSSQNKWYIGNGTTITDGGDVYIDNTIDVQMVKNTRNTNLYINASSSKSIGFAAGGQGLSTHGNINASGQWTIGADVSVEHTVNGVLKVGSSYATGLNVRNQVKIGGNPSIQDYAASIVLGDASTTASAQFAIVNGRNNAGASQGNLYFMTSGANNLADPIRGAGSFSAGSISSIGAWVLGPTSPTAFHTVNGALSIPSTTAGSTTGAQGGAQIDIYGSTNTERISIQSNGNAILQMGGFNGTWAAKTGVVAGTVLGMVQAGGYDTSVMTFNKTRVTFLGDGTWSPTSAPSKIQFLTTAAASVAAREVGSIDNAGAWTLGVGSSSTHTINGNLNVVGGTVTSANALTISSTGSATDLSLSSSTGNVRIISGIDDYVYIYPGYGGTLPSLLNNGLAINTNLSSGANQINYINTFSSYSGGHNWYQQTGLSTAILLGSVSGSGAWIFGAVSASPSHTVHGSMVWQNAANQSAVVIEPNANGTTTSPLNIAFNLLPTGTGTPIHVDSAGSKFLRNTSSSRYKENIVDSQYGLTEILQARPVQFNYIGQDITVDGFIAEEIVQIMPKHVALTAEGLPEAVHYTNMVATLTKAIQEQQDIINSLKARIELLEAK
jgi:hypothetical protein